MHTVSEMGWAGTGNGQSLALAAGKGFAVMITVDRGIEYQQNLDKLPIPVIVMLATPNRFVDLQPLVADIVDLMSASLQRRIYRVSG